MGGLDLLGADASVETRQRVDGGVLDFIKAYWFGLTIGALALTGVVLLGVRSRRFEFPQFDDAPGHRMRRVPEPRSYVYVGATSAVRESALRVRQANREVAKAEALHQKAIKRAELRAAGARTVEGAKWAIRKSAAERRSGRVG